jgi:hypothetical protein
MVCWCRACVNPALPFATRRRPAAGRRGCSLRRCGTIRSSILFERYIAHPPEQSFEGDTRLLFGKEGAASTNPFVRSALHLGPGTGRSHRRTREPMVKRLVEEAETVLAEVREVRIRIERFRGTMRKKPSGSLSSALSAMRSSRRSIAHASASLPATKRCTRLELREVGPHKAKDSTKRLRTPMRVARRPTTRV